MANRPNATAFHDPLNLVRVPKGLLQNEAHTVIQTMQQQKTSMQNRNVCYDEFDEIENNLDKWKQKRQTSFSPGRHESSEESPPSSFTMQSNIERRSTAQQDEKERTNGRSENRQKQLSTKTDFQVQKPSREMAYESKPERDLLRKTEISSHVEKNRNIDKFILRSKPSDTHASEINKAPSTTQESSKNIPKDYVRKSENRFKNARAFFEKTSKPVDDIVVRPQRSSETNKNKRMSWAPGMIDSTFNRQSSGKLSIANDKEFIIEEIDLNKTRVRMSTRDVRSKVEFTPRFVPNIESKYDEILRKKDNNAGDRKSRTEIISVDLGDKSAPVISLDDFKSFITSPEVIDEGNKPMEMPKTEDKVITKRNIPKEDKTTKENIFMEDKLFKNKICKEDKDENTLGDNILKLNITGKKQGVGVEKDAITKSSYQSEKVYLKNDLPKGVAFETNNYKNENTYVKNEYQKDKKSVAQKPSYNCETTFSQFEITKDIQTPIKNNEIRYEPVRSENLSDVLRKRMEERKSVFNTGLESKDKKELATNLKAEKILIDSFDPLKTKKEQKIEQSDNPFREFEETYNKQLDELNERKTKEIKDSSFESFEDRSNRIRTSSDEIKEKANVQILKTDYKYKSENKGERSFESNVSKKTEDSKPLKSTDEKFSWTEQNKNNMATLKNFKDTSDGAFMSKSSSKMEFNLKNDEISAKKEIQTEPMYRKVRSFSIEDELNPLELPIKQTDKPLPKVLPKPMSKTSKMIEKLSSSGFTPVLPGNAIPRRSKSMKVLRTPMSTAVVVDEVGVDMEEEWSASRLLDHSAQKSKSALARNAKRRPPTFYHARARLTKTQTFDCSNGYGLEDTDNQVPKRFSYGDDGLDVPILPCRPPPDATSEPRNINSHSNHNLISNFDQVDYFSTTPKSQGSNNMGSDEEESDV